MTKLRSELSTIINCVENNNNYRGNKHKVLFENIKNYILTGYPVLIIEILKYIGAKEGSNIYRKELWSDLKKLFSSFTLSPNDDLISLAR